MVLFLAAVCAAFKKSQETESPALLSPDLKGIIRPKPYTAQETEPPALCPLTLLFAVQVDLFELLYLLLPSGHLFLPGFDCLLPQELPHRRQILPFIPCLERRIVSLPVFLVDNDRRMVIHEQQMERPVLESSVGRLISDPILTDLRLTRHGDNAAGHCNKSPVFVAALSFFGVHKQILCNYQTFFQNG